MIDRLYFDDSNISKKYSYIAEVIKTYPSEMRCDIRPFYKDIENDSVEQPPIITKVPMQHGNFNGYSILWCPKVGDIVEVQVMSHEADTVLADNKIRNLESLRTNNINDSVIIGTLRTSDQELEYSGEWLEIRKEGTKIIIKNNEVYIETATVKIKGNVEIEGNIELHGDLKTDSVSSYNSHKHIGVQTGAGITGTPQ